MLKTLTLSLGLALGAGSAALAAGGAGEVKDYNFSFEGPFGKYDQFQLQRGLQVYTEICAGCHGLRYVPIRTLSDPSGPGLPEDQVRAYAELNFEVWDPDLLDGEGDYRAARPTDNFPANELLGAPDLSLMAKARAGFSGPYGTGINQLFQGMGGAEYVASLLAGYTGEEKEEAGILLYENKAFPGGWISMGPPLSDEQVEFADGHENTVEAMSQDVAAFLMWAAEPHLEARKRLGLKVLIYLLILTGLMYAVKRTIWSGQKH
jgi:ubiquinol-cytochrome c reductase cytochrome c1 subunit